MTEDEFHKQQAVDLFNATWTFMGKAERTREEDDAMLHGAHASRHHWSRVPDHTPTHMGRGEWQISRVYTVLGRGEPALHHARRCLDVCEANGIADFDIAFAHEAMARAHACLGNHSDSMAHRRRAHELSAHIEEDEDRQLLLNDLETGPWFGVI